VLLDYKMPLISACDVVCKMKRKPPDVPIVMGVRTRSCTGGGWELRHVHFGPGAALEDLVTTMHMLVLGSFMTQREPSLATNC